MLFIAEFSSIMCFLCINNPWKHFLKVILSRNVSSQLRTVSEQACGCITESRKMLCRHYTEEGSVEFKAKRQVWSSLHAYSTLAQLGWLGKLTITVIVKATIVIAVILLVTVHTERKGLLACPTNLLLFEILRWSIKSNENKQWYEQMLFKQSYHK